MRSCVSRSSLDWVSDWVSNVRSGEQTEAKSLNLLRKIGAGDRTRTYDLLITNQLLYQLSYAGTAGGTGPSLAVGPDPE